MDLSKLTLEIFSRLEQKWLTNQQDASSWRKTRILSIDGNGYKRFVAGDVLIHLEEQIRAKTGDQYSRIADFFDVIAGTGIGGIVAVMLTADDGNGRPKYTAAEAVEFLKQKRSRMLKQAGIFRRRPLAGKSFCDVMQAALRGADGRDLTLRDACKPLLVPCYDLNSSAPFVFSQADGTESLSFDFELWKVCRATSGSPSRFKPFELKSVDGKTSCVAVDGGLVMNNPSAAAVTHVLHNKRDFPSVNGVEDLMVLSLGNATGNDVSRPPRERPKRECTTAEVVEIACSGVSETVDQILANAFGRNPIDYLRIQANGLGRRGCTREDSAGAGVLEEKGVECLPFGGKRLREESNAERIDKFVERLVASGRALPPSPAKRNPPLPASHVRGPRFRNSSVVS